jgi:hypothetical protein
LVNDVVKFRTRVFVLDQCWSLASARLNLPPFPRPANPREAALRDTLISMLSLSYNVYASSIKITHPTQNATIPKSTFVFLSEFKAINSPLGCLRV